MLATRKSFNSLLLALTVSGVFCPLVFAEEAIDSNPNPPSDKPAEVTVTTGSADSVKDRDAKCADVKPGSALDSKVVSPESIPVSTVPDTIGIIETTAAEPNDVLNWKKKTLPPRPKIGLALGGGGARGAAHVPVIRALEKEGIKFDYIAGTSIGSVVGGLYAAGVSLDDLEDEFENGKLMRNFMTVSLAVRVAVAPVMLVPRLFNSKEYDGLYRGNKFRKYLVSGLSCHDLNIESLKIPFAAVTLNLLDGKPYMIRKGNLGFAMQASAAVPGLRKPVEIGDKLFVDGGALCNLPVKQVREMGADFVIAVNIDQPFDVQTPDKFRKIGSVTRRMLNWDLWEMDKPQSELADVTIHPNTGEVSLISTKKSDAKLCSIAGEKAVKEALPLIREKLKNLGIALGNQKSE
ncbi:MAG: patatin-like phospholipase family protein [Candidatus Obscuribacterales bacterium]|nr:patatin-like phospholipase family protein [Candidatus Obscuribacterales bacterium]